MTRAISLGGVPKPDPKVTGQRSCRSDDGSDLPARIQAAIVSFVEERGMNPTKVLLGAREWRELSAIIRLETRYERTDDLLSMWGAMPVRVCGLAALVDLDIESTLVVV